MTDSPHPDLAALLANPQRMAEFPLEAIPATISRLSALICQLSARQMEVACAPTAPTNTDHDDLLEVEEAAAEFNVSRDWLYRNWRRYNLGIKLSYNQVRISRKKFRRYLNMRHAA